MAREQQNERQRNVRSWRRLWLATAALLVLTPLLGLGVSAAYVEAWNAGLLSRWRRLRPLPARGVEIVTGTTDTVFVRTDTGSIYRCGPEGCWDEVQEPIEVSPGVEFDRLVYQGQVKPPTGTVVDTLETSVWWAEHVAETRYALMQDGSVFKWQYDRSIASVVRLALGPIAGLALGLVGILVLWVRKGVLAWRARARHTRGQGS